MAALLNNCPNKCHIIVLHSGKLNLASPVTWMVFHIRDWIVDHFWGKKLVSHEFPEFSVTAANFRRLRVVLHPVPGPGVRVFQVPFQHSGSGSGLRSNPETRIKNDVIFSKKTYKFQKLTKNFLEFDLNFGCLMSEIIFEGIAIILLRSFNNFVKNNNCFASFWDDFAQFVIPGPGPVPGPGPGCSNQFRVRVRVRVESHDPDPTLTIIKVPYIPSKTVYRSEID